MRYKIDVFDMYTAIHGREGMWVLFDNRLKNVSVDSSTMILTVVDSASTSNMPLCKNVDVNVIVVDVFVKWITKVKALLEYMKKNYDNIPDYVMYADAFDVCVLKDVNNVAEMLDYYKCDVLFNGEGNYTHDGTNPPDGAPNNYYDDIYYKHFYDYVDYNEKKYGHRHEKGLNAGLFVGKKSSVINMLEEAYEYMNGDYRNGFPWGCTSDQPLLRYVQIKNYNTISIDVYNKYLFHYTHLSSSNDINDCHHYLHYNLFVERYNKKIK